MKSEMLSYPTHLHPSIPLPSIKTHLLGERSERRAQTWCCLLGRPRAVVSMSVASVRVRAGWSPFLSRRRADATPRQSAHMEKNDVKKKKMKGKGAEGVGVQIPPPSAPEARNSSHPHSERMKQHLHRSQPRPYLITMTYREGGTSVCGFFHLPNLALVS